MSGSLVLSIVAWLDSSRDVKELDPVCYVDDSVLAVSLSLMKVSRILGFF